MTKTKLPLMIDRRTLLAGVAAGGLPIRSGATAMETPKMPNAREVMWRRVMDDLSFEYARIEPDPSGPVLSGTVLVAEKGAPLHIEYRIACDETWGTRTVDLTQTYRGRRHSLRLDHDGAGRWRVNGMEAPALTGCTDVDLGVSPSTNALPINRLRMAENASAVIRAAWVQFPRLEVVPAEQSYARLGDRRYRYRSLASGFEAIIDADRDGLPVEYAGVWRRVAEGPAGPIATPVAAPTNGFAGALLADGPAAELGRDGDNFGWLVGGWTARVSDFGPNGKVSEASGEWWFAWVLEGRAMQDVWISPARPDRNSGRTATGAKNRYGTTIRRFDRDTGIWRITWINPVSGATNHLAGKRDGDQIILLGEEDGRRIRWSFSNIMADRFTWLGESEQDSSVWRTEARFDLVRRP